MSSRRKGNTTPLLSRQASSQSNPRLREERMRDRRPVSASRSRAWTETTRNGFFKGGVRAVRREARAGRVSRPVCLRQELGQKRPRMGRVVTLVGARRVAGERIHIGRVAQDVVSPEDGAA